MAHAVILTRIGSSICWSTSVSLKLTEQYMNLWNSKALLRGQMLRQVRRFFKFFLNRTQFWQVTHVT